MNGRRFLQSIEIKQLLSFGEAGCRLDLQPLNVLIGQNASGKSNFLACIDLLRHSTSGLFIPMYDSGGVRAWKHQTSMTRSDLPSLEATISRIPTWRHLLKIDVSEDRASLVDEVIAPVLQEDIASNDPPFYYRTEGSTHSAYMFDIEETIKGAKDKDRWRRFDLTFERANDRSILSQLSDPFHYPTLYDLKELYSRIRIYTDLALNGPNSIRASQRADLSGEFLEESGRNLSFVLNNLQHRGALRSVIEAMKAVYDSVEDITVTISNGSVQTHIREQGLREPIPASRLSDGTLRYLCLLTILLHPEPPPLVCIEEPEVGLHPDLISSLADVIIEASQRMQIIVTTHSDLLVSRLSEIPESVIVCERGENGTTMKRLDKKDLESWLKDYSLGEVWLKGAIGGTRW